MLFKEKRAGEGDDSIITLAELRRTDFSISGLQAHRHTWVPGMYTDYLETGREQTLLHLAISGERKYTVNDRTFVIGAGSILLIPAKTKYYTITRTACTGIGICFDLYTAAGLLELEPDVYHIWQDHNGQYAAWMEELSLDALTDRRGILYRKMLLWRILDKILAEPSRDPVLENLLMPAMRYIGEHYRENLPVSAYADACHLSESHFRRKFFDYMGMTPIAYRDSLRFAEVRRLLETGVTLTKAAELTGFWDASHLRRVYRHRTGKTFLDNQKNDFV